jgi:Dyp-type peroxidase family
VDDHYLSDIRKSTLERLEKSIMEAKRKQPGVAFPSATTQEHLLIIRFNISHPISEREDKEIVRKGVMRLCKFLDRIDKGKIKTDDLTKEGDIRTVPLSEFNFSATIGFGMGFFEKLKIDSRNRPKKLKEMPNHTGLGDPRPYTLFQTDFIIQLGSDIEDVNSWVFQHTTARTVAKSMRRLSYFNESTNYGIDDGDVDICSCISDWATVTDIHTGFQRIDGRNLMGFNDGISNPKRLSNDVVWITSEDENQKFTDGTYMVFQKIEHDLDMWRSLTVEKQEEWVGRSKGTGLLLGTLPKDLDRKLASDLHSENPIVREQAKKQWKKLYDEQKDPDRKFFDPNQRQYRNIQLQCPVWSHVRKSNPRQADGAARSLIFRRGYLFSEVGSNGLFYSGLLFICFQRDIDKGFEYIKKNFLNNKSFPVPHQRKHFNTQELATRYQHGRFTVAELRRRGAAGIYPSHNDSLFNQSRDPDVQNTGREGLSGPSELGVYPEGRMPVTVSLGGGYYFIPPIPNKKISEISEQFFA